MNNKKEKSISRPLLIAAAIVCLLILSAIFLSYLSNNGWFTSKGLFDVHQTYYIIEKKQEDYFFYIFCETDNHRCLDNPEDYGNAIYSGIGDRTTIDFLQFVGQPVYLRGNYYEGYNLYFGQEPENKLLHKPFHLRKITPVK